MPRGKLSTEVREEIESLIGTEFKKGDKIPPEDALCERFGVSRATVREAIRELVAANVLEIRRGVGTYVTNHPGLVDDPYGLRFMDEKTLIHDIFETSLLFEPGMVELCAERISPEELGQLKDVQEQISSIFEKSASGLSPELERQLFFLDGRFHVLIARFTGNSMLYSIFRSYSWAIGEHVEAMNVRHALKSIEKYHPLLIEDFSRHDREAAREHMTLHDKEIRDSFGTDEVQK